MVIDLRPCQSNETQVQSAHRAVLGRQNFPVGWDIVCDFDGTITPFDVTDAILGRFALPEWEIIEEEWLRGRVSGRECMKNQVELIRASQAELNAFLDAVPIDAGFYDFTRHCVAQGLALRILSDGMDYAIRRVLERHNLHTIPVVANRLVFQGGNKYTLEFPFGAEGCGSGVCKCEVAGSKNKKILLIGDGHSDCCLAEKSTFTLAKKDKELLRHCTHNEYPCQSYADFFDVNAFFQAHSESRAKEDHRASPV